MAEILVLSTIPAPYRTNVFDLLREKYHLSIFFERISDDNRNADWFTKNGDYIILNCKESRDLFKRKLRHIDSFDLALVYEYSTFRAAKLMLRCIIKKVPYVINCDGALLQPNFIKDLVKRFFIMRSAANLANGKSANDYFQYYGARKEKIYFHKFTSLFKKDILSSILTENEKVEIRKRIGIEGNRVVIAVGRFIKLKNFDVLIRSWRKMDPGYTLLVIGGGEERGHYERIIRDNMLNNVQLVGYKSKEELKEYYLAADLLVLPTSSDVWGLVVNEAMACGLPVITTDKCVAGLELIKDNENGFLVPVGDENILSEKINIILSNDDLRREMSINNLEAIKEYTIENVVKSHIAAFEGILNSNKKRGVIN